MPARAEGCARYNRRICSERLLRTLPRIHLLLVLALASFPLARTTRLQRLMMANMFASGTWRVGSLTRTCRVGAIRGMPVQTRRMASGESRDVSYSLRGAEG